MDDLGVPPFRRTPTSWVPDARRGQGNGQPECPACAIFGGWTSPKSIQELGFMDGLWLVYGWFMDCLGIFLVPNIVFLMMFNEYIGGGIEMNELRWCHDHAANGGIKSPFISTLIVKKYGTRFHHMVYRHFPDEMGVNGCTLWLRQNSELENLHKNSGFSMIFPINGDVPVRYFDITRG